MSNLGFVLAAGAALIATGAAGGAYFMNKESKSSESKENSNEYSKEETKEDRPPVPSLNQSIEESVRQAASSSVPSPLVPVEPVPSPVVPVEPVPSPVVPAEPVPSPVTTTPAESPTSYATPTAESPPTQYATPEGSPTVNESAQRPIIGGGRTRCKHCNQQLQYRKKSRRKLIA